METPSSTPDCPTHRKGKANQSSLEVAGEHRRPGLRLRCQQLQDHRRQQSPLVVQLGDLAGNKLAVPRCPVVEYVLRPKWRWQRSARVLAAHALESLVFVPIMVQMFMFTQ